VLWCLNLKTLWLKCYYRISVIWFCSFGRLNLFSVLCIVSVVHHHPLWIWYSHDVFVVLWLKVLTKCLIVYCMNVWMYISVVSFFLCITQDAQGHLGFYIMRLGECKLMNFPLLKWLKLCATSARIFLITFRWYYWSFLTSTSETCCVCLFWLSGCNGRTNLVFCHLGIITPMCFMSYGTHEGALQP
jgi:hypothetical protein